MYSEVNAMTSNFCKVFLNFPIFRSTSAIRHVQFSCFIPHSVINSKNKIDKNKIKREKNHLTYPIVTNMQLSRNRMLIETLVTVLVTCHHNLT